MTVEVLHVHAGNLYGGVETILTNLARFADATPEMRSRYALCFEGRLADELRHAGAPVEVLGAVRLSRPWTVARARARLRALLSTGGAGAVVCHSDWSQAIFGPVAKATHRPLVRWMHGPAAGTPWLERWASRTRPIRTICASHFVEATLHRLHPELPSEVIYAPMVPAPSGDRGARRDAMRRTLGVGNAEVAILQVGRMEPGKGLTILLHALSELRDLSPWVCWLAGGAQRRSERSYERRMHQLASRLGLADRCRFLGLRADVPDLLAAADMFCQPSTAPEGLGLGTVEALYAGLPVVVSDAGGSREAVDASCGIVVPPGSAAALAADLRRLVERPDERATLAAGGTAFAASRFGAARQVGKVAEVFHALVRAGERA